MTQPHPVYPEAVRALPHDEAAQWMLTQEPAVDPHPDDIIHVFFLVQSRLTGETIAVPSRDLERYADADAWVKRQPQPELYTIRTIYERVLKVRPADPARRPAPESPPLSPSPAHARPSRWRRWLRRDHGPKETGTPYERVGRDRLWRITELLDVRLFGPPGTVPFSCGGDPFLMPHFLNPDGTYPNRLILRDHLTMYLTDRLGGPKHYTGRSMTAAHAGRRITDKAFDVFVQHLAMAMTDAGLSPELIAEISAMVIKPLRPAVAQVPTLPEPPAPARVPRPLG